MRELELKRQIVHAAGVLTIAPLLLGGKVVGAAAIAVVLAIFVFWAFWRKTALHRVKAFTAFDRIAEGFVSAYERPDARPLAGAIYFYAGSLVAALAFEPHVAAVAIAVLALADAASTVVGHYLGKHKLPINPKKSWEGSVTFFLTALAVLMFFVSPVRALPVAFFTMAVEALPKINDNVSIPVTVGCLLTALTYLNL